MLAGGDVDAVVTDLRMGTASGLDYVVRTFWPGATAVMDLPAAWCEPVEVMVAATLALATCNPEKENGMVVRSGPYLRERGLLT